MARSFVGRLREADLIKAAVGSHIDVNKEGYLMSRIALIAIAATASMAPLVVQAQSNGYGGGRTADYTYSNPDMNYCAALADLYVRYVGRSESGPSSNRRPDVVGGVALAKCHEGDTAAAIPILEQKLTDARVSLPARAR